MSLLCVDQKLLKEKLVELLYQEIIDAIPPEMTTKAQGRMVVAK